MSSLPPQRLGRQGTRTQTEWPFVGTSHGGWGGDQAPIPAGLNRTSRQGVQQPAQPTSPGCDAGPPAVTQAHRLWNTVLRAPAKMLRIWE